MVVKRIINDELYHHGVQGQKWGVRRYQNKDGSLTPEGRRHYNINETTKSGAKIGALAGVAYGGALAATTAAMLNPVFGVPIAAAYAATYAAVGIVSGLEIGSISGALVGLGRQASARSKNVKLGDIDHNKQIKDFNKKIGATADPIGGEIFKYKPKDPSSVKPRKNKPVQDRITDMYASGASTSQIARETGLTEAQVKRLQKG